jgi:hypothetical protein
MELKEPLPPLLGHFAGRQQDGRIHSQQDGSFIFGVLCRFSVARAPYSNMNNVTGAMPNPAGSPPNVGCLCRDDVLGKRM